MDEIGGKVWFTVDNERLDKILKYDNITSGKYKTNSEIGVPSRGQFYDEVKKITCIDMDSKVISRAKYELFKDYNVDFITGDVFEFRDQYKNADLFINTSCEHMKPMREWGPAPEYKNPWWDRVSPAYFAFQSNAMFDIPTHINCVNNIEEFKKQLPDRAEVLIEDEIPDERGTRFTLIGKIWKR